jgi:class 3 adenylate cyclase/tetratricopeptide (TPR) repeat protein
MARPQPARKPSAPADVSTLRPVERKLATVLFIDLVDSTGLVTSADPEVVRRRVSGFFDQVAACVLKHGGIVEKFAGDAVMAAFGIPQAHEDDAERAVRTALEVLAATDVLRLQARAGVESGEVVADDTDSTFATGEAVNFAARLQQSAQPGQILIGPNAYRLTLDRIQVEDAGPVEVRGRTEPLWAWRAIGAVEGGGRALSLEAPLVGRDVEIALLEATYTRAVRNKRAHLVTIYGEPGVGKSRLAREFVEGLEGATILQGRSLPYGEGITYWPLAEMVKTSAGINDDEPVRDAFDKLRACCEDEAVADLLGLAAGLLEAVEDERSQQEIAWAAREWAAKLAYPQPLVLVFEDIHWGEEPLHELIEHVAEFVRDAPLFILVLARPELLEVRPAWGGGRTRATMIELEPLAEEESSELIDALLAGANLAGECRSEVLEVSEGNPLFVEETIRMIAEGGDTGRIPIPNTLQALIAARIDRLPQVQKRVLQRAAIVGRIFWDGALAHLSPEIDDIEPLLEELHLRELVLAESRSSITGQRAYKFKHVLIREVAYQGLSKSSRAALHAQFAVWLKERAGDELLEIRAFHLDRAAELLAELDGAPPEEVAKEAAEALHHAGKRAFSREAYRTARKLLLRAVELEPTLDRRWLAARAAQRLADMPAVMVEMEEVRAQARAAGNSKLEGRALTALADVTLFTRADVKEAKALVNRALELLPEDAPLDARVDALSMRVNIAQWVGDVEAVKKYLPKIIDAAQAAGRKDLEASATDGLAGMYLNQLEFDEARPLVARSLELAVESGMLIPRAHALQAAGRMHHLERDYDEAAVSYLKALALYQEIGLGLGVAWTLKHLGTLALNRGQLQEADEHLREALKILKKAGDRAYLCEVQRSLAEVKLEEGKLEEATRLALEARDTVGPQDMISQMTTQFTLGLVRAAQGKDVEAEQLLRDALARAEESPFRLIEREALERLAKFLRARGRDSEAEAYEDRIERGPLTTAA